MLRSMAAWRSPTTTATPWEVEERPPGMRSVMAPKARAALATKPWTPSTLRAVRPASSATTLPAMVVRPWVLASGEGPVAGVGAGLGAGLGTGVVAVLRGAGVGVVGVLIVESSPV